MSKTSQNPPANPATDTTATSTAQATTLPTVQANGQSVFTVTTPASEVTAPDGTKLAPMKAGDAPQAIENASSTGQGSTQNDANKAAGGGAYRCLSNVSYSLPDGTHAIGLPQDIITLSEADAVGLLANKAVEHADQGAPKPAEDPRKIT